MGLPGGVSMALAEGKRAGAGRLRCASMREASQALDRFLVQSLTAGRRCVRIIHGKGRGSDGQQPVLKQKTNQWLRQRDEVLAFVTAPRWDGGTGAVYVLLSGKRRQAG